jgi:hypothetical protein
MIKEIELEYTENKLENYISTAIENLTKAKDLKDRELILACFINLRETLDSYIEILED